MQGGSEAGSPWLGYLGSSSLAVCLSLQELCQLQGWLLVPSKDEKLAPPLAPVQPSALLSQQKDLCFLPLPSPRAEMSLSHLPCGHRMWYYIRNKFCNPISTNHCHSYCNNRQMQHTQFMFLLFFATVCMCFPFNYSIWISYLSFFPFLHLKLNLISVIYR